VNTTDLDIEENIRTEEVVYKPRRNWLQIPFSDPIAMIKLGVWVYYILLLFEGALRKWFLPGLATPLLIIRDPIALFIIIKAFQYRLFPSNMYIRIITVVTIIAVMTTLVLGHGNIMVSVFGARVFLLHFPMLFIMGKILTRKDVLMIMKFTLWISLPMALLTVMQFHSPQSAWVNRGVGGNMEGAGFSGSGEYFRPPGTFSFTTGNVQFFSMMAAFVFYFFLDKKHINKFVLMAGFVGLLISIPFSISRSLLLNTMIAALFTALAAVRKPKFLGQILSIVAVAALAVMIASKTSFFKESLGAFTDRFEVATEAEGGAQTAFLDRVVGGMFKGLQSTTGQQQPFFGVGIGMGSNVGAQLLGGSGFMVSEDEWGRLIGEMGLLLGFIVIMTRVVIALRITSIAYGQMRHGDVLPWILMSYGFMILVNGQWSQPTSLGFAVIIGGLMLASLKKEI
jgi:hypothetical protein